MLEKYFVKPGTVDRIRESWIAEPIEQYVVWLTEQGYNSKTILRRVPWLVQFGAFAQQRGAKQWSELSQHIDEFVAFQVESRGSNKSPERQQNIDKEIRGPVRQMLWVLFPDVMPNSCRRKKPFPTATLQCVPQFFEYLSQERGIRQSTIRTYNYCLSRFQDYLNRIGITDLQSLSAPVVSALVVNMCKSKSRSTNVGICSALRVFLRYLHRERLVTQDFSVLIESPQIYTLSEIPRAIPWSDVRRMLDAVDRRTALGKRDYAILLLLVTYGLRAREVAALTLDDIDWKHDRLFVSGRKAGHSDVYPLSSVVGNAIIDYLKKGRPQVVDRHIFFRAVAPFTPLTFTGISITASKYLHRANVQVARPGSHTLRHTCVNRLLEAELPLKTIGDYVGHRSAQSTRIYAKLDVESLREVAMGDGEEIV